MAARHLRRLQQQPQPAVAVSHDDDPSTDESEEQEETTAPFNPFDLLTDGDVSYFQSSSSWGSPIVAALHVDHFSGHAG